MANIDPGDSSGFPRIRRVRTTYGPPADFEQAEEAVQNLARAQPPTRKVSTYQYTNIDYKNDIRILRILAGNNVDDLRCIMLTSALPAPDNKPSPSKLHIREYWALSYWWGSDEPSHPIQMWDYDAQTQRRVFQGHFFYVRNNLAAALKQLRHKEKDVDVWVDAICINQDGENAKTKKERAAQLKEKTAQVLRMDEVYSEAKNVCIWLGSGRNSHEKAEIRATFEFLRKVLNLKELETFINSESNPEKWEENIQNWRRVVKLMENPWFGRRWVIQELVLAKVATIHWDEQQMIWSDFADAVSLIMTLHDRIVEMLRTPGDLGENPEQLHDPRALGANTLVNATTNLFRKSEDGKVSRRMLDLEVLVSSMFLPFEASEPRDTIYAVLSLARDTENSREPRRRASWWIPSKPNFFMRFMLWLLRLLLGRWFWVKQAMPESYCIDPRVSPNYDKSLLDTCADFMEYCVQKSTSLDILCRHWAPEPILNPNKLETLGITPASKESKKPEVLPSWISLIKHHTYGGPKGSKYGRKNGDSLVGGFERYNQQHYNASGGLQAWAEFERNSPPKRSTWKKNQAQVQTIPLVSSGDGNGVPSDSSDDEEIQAPGVRLNNFTGSLKVRGFVIATIKEVSDQVKKGLIPKRALEFGGFDWSKSQERSFPAQVHEKLWRTLVADRGPEGLTAPAWYRRACLECLALVDVHGEFDTEKIRSSSDVVKTMKIFLTRVQGVVWNRRFCLADGRKDKALIGLVPNETQVGDLLCIMLGCSVPVVLKRMERKTGRRRYETYKLIGESYVHGKMEGEEIPDHPGSRPEYPYDGVKEFVLT